MVHVMFDVGALSVVENRWSPQLVCAGVDAMRRLRPTLVHDPELCCRHYSSTAWRWRSGSLTMLIAVALMALSAAEVADDAHARRTRLQAVGGAGFIAPASTAAGWTSFSRQGQKLRSVGGLRGASARGGGSHHRHSCAIPATSSASICCEGQTSGRQRSSSSVARVPQLRTSDHRRRRRGSSSSSRLLLLASAVGADVNATVGAEIASPIASAEVALPSDVGTKKNGQPPPPSQSSRTKKSTSIEGKEATVIITEAGGRPHTVASKAKISAANKGKKPWNVGVGHSEETRRKIAEGARNAAKRRREKTAESLVREMERGNCGWEWVGGFSIFHSPPAFLRCDCGVIHSVAVVLMSSTAFDLSTGVDFFSVWLVVQGG